MRIGVISDVKLIKTLKIKYGNVFFENDSNVLTSLVLKRCIDETFWKDEFIETRGTEDLV